MASEVESDLQNTVDWGRKWLVDFSAGKTQLVLFDCSNNNGSIHVKMDVSVIEERLSLKLLGLTFSSKVDWGSYIISIAKTASMKIVLIFLVLIFFILRALICSMKFLLLRLLCISINLPYVHVWNTVVMSGLVPLVATWNC